MIPFRYKPISQSLINELHEKVCADESIVILGPRYGGKADVMNRVRRLLEEKHIHPIVKLRLPSETPVCTSLQIAKVIRDAVIEAEPKVQLGTDLLADNPFSPIRQLVDQTERRVVLFAANVDGMSHHLALRFLQELRTLVDSHRLVAVLSGENDFRELVHGHNSEFSCANQYMLQGHAFGEFYKFLKEYIRYLNLEFATIRTAARRMWKSTGGNLYILRVLLWSIIEQRGREHKATDIPVNDDEIPDRLKFIGIPGAYEAHIFRHATELIARDWHCWEELQTLRRNARLGPLIDDAPGPLELAGIATRKISSRVTELRFSSPIMEAFIKRFYDARRFGDLYARIGKWDEAFERYRQLDPEERVRPSSTDDKTELEATIGAFCSALYSRVAVEGERHPDLLQVESVKELFAKGCRYILGFSEITFWHRDTLQTPEWRLHSLDTIVPGREVTDRIEELLPATSERNLRTGIIESRKPLGKLAITAVLPARHNKQVVVVVSDFSQGNLISHERRLLIAHVLGHFFRAYRQAVEIDNLHMRHRITRKLEDIIDSIFGDLGSHNFNVDNLLRKAAIGLRDLQYSRVLFCLVDKELNRIAGRVEESDHSSVNVAQYTNWSLKNPTADLQPFVVHTKRPKIIADARREPLANKEIVDNAGITAAAIVPILNPAEDVIGTIHIERVDRAVPTREEVDDLMSFGRHLAIAIGYGDRVRLPEDGLDIPQSLEAWYLPAEATTTQAIISRMLDLLKQAGHDWGRFYLVKKSTDGDSLFVSELCYGSNPRETEVEFNARKVVLAPRSDVGHRDWLCIDQKKPILFCYKQDRVDGHEYTTPEGLKVINWVEPDQPPQIRKRPGDFWMDFPLVHKANVLGKVCLQLDEHLPQKNFERLKIMSGYFAAILATSLKRDEEIDTREQMIKKSVADKTMATMAHNLGTRLGSLPVILDRYRFMARKCPDIQALNYELEDIIDYAQTTVRRANELLSPVNLRLEIVDLSAQVTRTLKLNLPINSWKFHCEGPSPLVELDAHLFETALLELVKNSRDFVAPGKTMSISITIETIVAAEETGVLMVYRDNGLGVPDKFREQIFDDFFSRRPNQKIPGTGLGMGFVRRVIEAHRGHIFYSGQMRADDSPAGAQFSIKLPALSQP